MKNKIKIVSQGIIIGLVLVLFVAGFSCLIKKAHRDCKEKTFNNAQYRECLGI